MNDRKEIILIISSVIAPFIGQIVTDLIEITMEAAIPKSIVDLIFFSAVAIGVGISYGVAKRGKYKTVGLYVLIFYTCLLLAGASCNLIERYTLRAQGIGISKGFWEEW